MDNNFKVSILMLTYNHENYIDQAIRGVVLQKVNFPIELVIANDSSNDNTLNKAKIWQKDYPSIIKIIDNKTNLGLQQNFINSFNSCKGEYIAICEGDDFWIDSHKLQRQVDFLDSHKNYSICAHRVITYYEADNSKAISNGIIKKDHDILDLAKSNFIVNVSVVFRNNLVNNLPQWFEKVPTYDYAIHLLNAQYGNIFFMNRPMAVYRNREDAIWSTASADKKWIISLNVREILMNHFKDNIPVYKNLLSAYNNIGISLINFYDKQKGIEKVNEYTDLILKHNENWTLEDINHRLKTLNMPQKGGIKNRFFKMASSIRREISKHISLPQIS
ncbi:MAG: glycosyltransferase [Bacteroidales bacterium]|nr:glycosyltransferase [Bacteroidales bacterium]